MARKKKPRYKDQGIDFVIGQYRAIAKDKEVPAWIRMAAVDRLAVIDSILKVELIPLATRVAKLPASPVSDLKPEPEIVPVEDDPILDAFNRKYYNGGVKNVEPTDSKN